MKAIGFFIIGVLCGLTVSELMKDAKPVDRIVIHGGYRLRYNYPSYYPYGYDYYYRPLEYRGGVRRQANTRNDEGRRGGNVEQGETHFEVRQVNDRKKN